MTSEKMRASLGEEPAELVLKNGMVINVFTSEILQSDVAVSGGRIVGVGDYSGLSEIDCSGKYIAPGFIDAHVHIESSMLTPEEFSKLLIPAGTTSIVADPHEAVNVSGTEALDWLINAAEKSLMDIYYMIPSSVPASDTEINGAGDFLADDMRKYTDDPHIIGLGETMRFFDVIRGEKRMADKIELFHGRKIDGHAPGLSGHDLQAYRYAGVDSDHECTSFEEALAKLRAGFALLVREGSGAKNLEPLIRGLLHAGLPLDRVMFCTDDKHTAEIKKEGHINACVRKAISLGLPAPAAYRMGSLNAAAHYGLAQKGAVCPGYDADLLIIDDLEQVRPAAVIKNGRLLTKEAVRSAIPAAVPDRLKNTVIFDDITPLDISVRADKLNDVIGMTGHSITTIHLKESVPSENGLFIPNREYNKLCVIERHGRTGKTAAAPIKGFKIQNGAVASTVAHDSHNLIIAGDNDRDILRAAEAARSLGGGYAIASEGRILALLPLPICGLMSDTGSTEVEMKASQMLEIIHGMGVPEDIDPFTTLSFMALTVIPELRLTESGLFDVVSMKYL